MSTKAVATIGHSNLRPEVIAAALAEADVETLIDCRSIPRSRYNPGFNSKAFADTLSGYAVTYEWRGDSVGGLQQNVNHEETLDEIAERAKGGEKLALMCSEGSYLKCHRGTDLAPALLARDLAIHHIQPGKPDVILKPSKEDTL